MVAFVVVAAVVVVVDSVAPVTGKMGIHRQYHCHHRHQHHQERMAIVRSNG